MKQKTYYYSTYEDEVEQDNITPPKIDKNYKYLPKNIFSKFWSWFYYRIIIFPIGWLYCKFKGFKYINYASYLLFFLSIIVLAIFSFLVSDNHEFSDINDL